MSSNARSRRNLRVGDLAMPSVPSHAGPSSASMARITQRSVSRIPHAGLSSSPEPIPGAAMSSGPVVVGVNKRKREADDDLFGDGGSEDPEVVDLVDKDEVPAEILSNTQQEKKKNWVKLGALDCVICMDNATDLTVTHCGHLFCSECLHSALNMDPSRRICPICRRKIDKLPGCGKFGQKGKGFYPLELKLMTKETLSASREHS
ncbi:hypothetical protein C8A03DRAFT_32031 [Achaetomium macrosporum]|uniref:RING-type domain-containing protein n=1 Tax=Achaetomium macrosporum TaxID=79813 RepID=A0AAN7HFD6_9PEZI|nr:hypothetical protein C8A03DRAFT_32031 [Achaetomium macrosporum]